MYPIERTVTTPLGRRHDIYPNDPWIGHSVYLELHLDCLSKPNPLAPFIELIAQMGKGSWRFFAWVGRTTNTLIWQTVAFFVKIRNIGIKLLRHRLTAIIGILAFVVGAGLHEHPFVGQMLIAIICTIVAIAIDRLLR